VKRGVFAASNKRPERSGVETTDEVTPLSIDGTLLFCALHQNAIALDGAAGEEKWRLDQA
jgi:glucose dehydrogenase